MVACDIGVAMAIRGHLVHLISDARPERLPSDCDRLQFHGFGAGDELAAGVRPYLLPLAARISDVARRHRLDLVHVHYGMPHGLSAWLARRELRAEGVELPIVLTLHGTDVTSLGPGTPGTAPATRSTSLDETAATSELGDPFQRAAVRFAIDEADVVTTPSAWLRAEVQRTLEVQRHVGVIGNFVDPAVFTPRAISESRDDSALAALFVAHGAPLRPDESVVMHVSNFRAVKRAPLLADIFANVVDNQPARLVLIGDGPERVETLRLLDDAGLSNRVLWIGKRQHFADLLMHADVFVLPSASESFGLAALESLSCGVPVVAGHQGGLPEVVRDGVTGRLVPEASTASDTAQALGKAVLAVLGLDPQQRHVMREAARADVLARFQAKPVIDEFERIYTAIALGQAAPTTRTSSVIGDVNGLLK